MELSQKRFHKRNAILSCLRGTKLHPTAEWIHEQLRLSHSDISLATVYRNLSLFKKQGLIQSVATVNGTERFDGNPLPHVHFICTGCDAVMDLEGIRVPQELRSAASQCAGGTICGCQLTFTGLCSQCQQNYI